MDDLGEFEVHAGRGGDLGQCRRLQLRHAAEMHLKGFAALGADAGDVVEERTGRLLVAHLRLERVGEAVRLVPDALDQVERLAVARQNDRIGLVGQKQMLELLGKPRQRHGHARRLHRRQRRGDLPAPAVHN